MDPRSPILAVLTADTVGTVGGGPILPHPGFVTLAAAPPSVIRLEPAPGPLLTGESLARLVPVAGRPFSLPPILLPEKTRFARPGEVAAARRLIPRTVSVSDDRDALVRRSDWPAWPISVRGAFSSVDEVVETNDSSWYAPNSVTNCCIDGTTLFFRILPKLEDFAFRRGRGRIGRLKSALAVFASNPSSASTESKSGCGA